MKPANFPARKDARRRRAIARLEAPPTRPGFEETAAQRRARADHVALKLAAAPRDIRSKKLRGIGR